MKTIFDLMARHPFLEGFDAPSMRFIAGCGRNVVFKAGVLIFKEGGAADSFYLLRGGTVLLETHVPGRGAVAIQSLAAGDMLGSNWLIPPYRWSFDARAQDEVRAIAFNAQCLRDKLEDNPAVGYQLMKRFVPALIRRMEAARLQALDLYGRPDAKSAP